VNIYRKCIDFELKNCFGRKIDYDLKICCVHPETGDVFCTGKDKILKRYKQPDEPLNKMELKTKIPPLPPIDENDGHTL